MGETMPAFLAILFIGAPFEATSPELSNPELSPDPPTVRAVRVLVASGVRRVTLVADELLVGESDSADSAPEALSANDGLEVSCRSHGRIVVGGQVHTTSSLTVRTADGEPLGMMKPGGTKKASSPVRYPGSLRFVSGENGRCNVVSVVDVETYVGCVVGREVWPTFAPAAYRAQAIASRTFVLYQMKRRGRRAYDVVATQGAQVYRGLRDDVVGKWAVAAARDTRGIVLTTSDGDAEGLFSTFYSAACGGMSQTAGIFSADDDVEPLRGGVPCDYCRIAPGNTYRWGPVRMTLKDVRDHLLETYPKYSSLGVIRRVEVVETTDGGRAVRVRVSGSSGESVELLAERFRLALGGSRIRSTHFELRVEDGRLVFEKGRGFGHGLGLCQWGMQGQALEGRSAGEILRYYYPGSTLRRVY